MNFEGRVAVITGAATGMGRSLAIKLVEKGVTGLALCDLNMSELAHTASLCESAAANRKSSMKLKSGTLKVTTHEVDVSKEEMVKRFRDEVIDAHNGRVHFLFNNAGISVDGRMVYPESWTEDEIGKTEKMFDKCFDVNFYGTLYMTRAFLPTLVAQDQAALVNTSSVNGFWVWPWHAPYCASKAAVKGMTESLMVEMKLKHPHVLVSCVHPGGVRTEIASSMISTMSDKAQEEKEKKLEGFAKAADLSPDQAADWILWGVKRKSTRILVGYDAIGLDAMIRTFPRLPYSMYDTLRSIGFARDYEELLEKQPFNENPFNIVRFFFGGGWVYALFLGWTLPLRLRHVVSLKMVTGGVALAALATGGWMNRQKLFNFNSNL